MTNKPLTKQEFIRQTAKFHGYTEKQFKEMLKKWKAEVIRCSCGCGKWLIVSQEDKVHYQI